MSGTGAGTGFSLDAIRAKMEYDREHPEEAAATDAAIRTARPSVAARAMVEAVRSAQQQGLSKEEIGAQMPEAKEAFPHLFRMVNDPGHSQELVTAILAQLESVERGAKTTHDASSYMGVILANRYVCPAVGSPPLPLPEPDVQLTRP